MSSYTPSAHPTLPSGANQASAPKLGPHDHHRIAGEDYDNDEFLPPPASLKPTGVVTRWLSVIHENRGLLFLLISQFFGSLMNVIARILSTGLLGNQRFHALQILFVRQSITTAGCLIWMWYNGIFPLGDRKVRGLLVVRGLGMSQNTVDFPNKYEANIVCRRFLRRFWSLLLLNLPRPQRRYRHHLPRPHCRQLRMFHYSGAQRAIYSCRARRRNRLARRRHSHCSA